MQEPQDDIPDSGVPALLLASYFAPVTDEVPLIQVRHPFIFSEIQKSNIQSIFPSSLPGEGQSRQQSVLLSAWDNQCKRRGHIISRIGSIIQRNQGQASGNSAITEPRYWPTGSRC